MSAIFIVILLCFLALLAICSYLAFQIRTLKQTANQNELLVRLEEREKTEAQYRQDMSQKLEKQLEAQHQFRNQFDQHQINNLQRLQESLEKSFRNVREEVGKKLDENIGQLTNNTEKHLKEISGQVEKRLTDGFEKTSAVFTDVVKRLALIDEAQKKITELSGNVVNLQTILSDKRSRGAFGEVQLNTLVRNVLPENSFAIQHTLSNGKRPDCLLLLPPPTGNIVIDAKFPLESYQRLVQTDLSKQQTLETEGQFKKDIQKHIQDVSQKYIIQGETSDGVILFIPAEAIFAEIHANYPELVEMAHRLKVWIASPTTLMAILTTASAALKDVETQKQVHIIQAHLMRLGEDFTRFQKRMDKLSDHINLAHRDVEEVHTSSRKIISRFQKIEKVELKDSLLELDTKVTS